MVRPQSTSQPALGAHARSSYPDFHPDSRQSSLCGKTDDDDVRSLSQLVVTYLSAPRGTRTQASVSKSLRRTYTRKIFDSTNTRMMADNAHELSPAVRAVCEQKDAAVDLVMAHIHEFLDVSPRCSLMTAALAGHVHLVKRLSARHPQPFDGCCQEAMDSAAEFGHLEIVQWLHENREEGCTSDAMDMAASNGHLDVVQWLHVNRNEGCTTSAMDFAAQNGHMHVLEWLHEHRSEGCTHSAMDNAASSGQLRVMQWLHIHRTEGCSKSALVNACYGGHYNVALWLLAFRRKDCRKEDVLSSSFCSNFLLERWQQKQTQKEQDRLRSISATPSGPAQDEELSSCSSVIEEIRHRDERAIALLRATDTM